MEKQKDHLGTVSRRMIGNVSVFDLSGTIKCEEAKRIGDYISAYVKEGRIRFGILNVQDVKFIDYNSIKDIVGAFQGLKKAVLYYDSPDIGEVFEHCPMTTFLTQLNSERNVVEVLGKELLNRKSFIFFEEKRSKVRIKSAIAADLVIHEKNGKDVIVTNGIISNLSETGAYIEYLDLRSAALIQQMDYFKNFTATIHASHSFYREQDLQGEIVRVEISGNQTSIAIKFLKSIEIFNK